MTPDHPFWVLDGTPTHSGEWSAAAELGVGDLLLSSEGEPVAVTTVSESAGGVAVYNFEVRDAHTYFVGSRGVLVHNACDESLTGDSGGGSVGNKRGPKTDPNAPHNRTIREEGDKLAAEGNTILAGGGREKEKLIPTPGGKKGGRRPDILYETSDGILKGRNVGKTKSDGSPVKREQEALEDLNNAGVETDFVPYD